MHCIVIQAGVNMAYSTVLIGGLQANNQSNYTNDEGIGDNEEKIIIDKNDESWIGESYFILLPTSLKWPHSLRAMRARNCLF